MAPRRKPGPKPRTKLAGQKVSRPKRSLLEAIELVREHAPHLLATNPELKPPVTGLYPDDAVVGDRVSLGETYDLVNHPTHYKGANGIECIECQEAAVADSPLHGFAAHLIATIIGYAFRCGKKDSALTDAKKLRWYAEKLVSTLEKES